MPQPEKRELHLIYKNNPKSDRRSVVPKYPEGSSSCLDRKQEPDLHFWSGQVVSLYPVPSWHILDVFLHTTRDVGVRFYATPAARM